MNIGIISDTHGCAETWEKVYTRYFMECELIIHAGDILYHGPRNDIPLEYNPKKLAESLNSCSVPIIVASGNCDADVDGMVLTMPIQSPYAYIMIEGIPIVVNHGHTLTEQTQQEMAAKFKAALFITGHTHIPSLEKRNGIIYLNPGSPAMSKRPDKRGTIARLIDRTIEVLDVATGQLLMSERL
ncbi:phosphodiesterase [Pelosinus sp. sgz500959]|uniref:phosphodiesterase n=1 Tax=Pelosinus sp. sgz500959 TaxID=3242472 RepID=UPI003671E3E5